MAPRKKPLPRTPAPTAIRLTKKDVVRRELATAIRLFVGGGDPVAIHVLASAASAVLQPIAEAKGHLTGRSAFLDIYIKDEYRREAELLVDEWFNYMKHGARDPDAELNTFNPEINKMLLFLLCRDYMMVFREIFSEAAVFMATLGSIEPRFLVAREQPAFLKLVEGVKKLARTNELSWDTAKEAFRVIDEATEGAAALGIDIKSLGPRP